MSPFIYETADILLYGRLKAFAKENRKKETDAEHCLWMALRARQTGYRFKRQHIIGPFIADFVCLDARLIVEVDGGYHSEKEQIIADEERTQWLNSNGYTVLRYTNEQIMFNTDDK